IAAYTEKGHLTMCGRFTLTVDPAQLVQQFGVAGPPPADLSPRYNIAPTQSVLVIANEGEPGERKLELFKWGLIPSWAKDPKTCTIITTEPNELTAQIHNRMPVILSPENYAAWLTPGELPTIEALAMLKTYPAAEMRARPVSTAVNSPAKDAPELVSPLAM